MSENTLNSTVAPGGDDSAAPLWLSEALRMANVPSETFRPQCLRAAETALSLIKLREAGRRAGFSLTPVCGYLNSLASLTSIRLEPLLEWAGLKPNAPADRDFAVG